MNTIYHAVYETMADWETGHATAHIRNGQYHREPGRYELVTVGLTTGPVTTMGGLRVTPDVSIGSIEDAAMLILPGAALWDEGDELAPSPARPASSWRRACRSRPSAARRPDWPGKGSSTPAPTPAPRCRTCRCSRGTAARSTTSKRSP
nr:hypothetical protein GCM10020093_030390 [Planobispora longispora]